MEQFHAHQICGISVHVKDRGVASVALRSLAIAAECLTVRREQEEVLQLFIRIHKETGWRIGFIPKDLAKSWGWTSEPNFKLPTQDEPAAGLGLTGSRFANDHGGHATAGAMQGSGYAAHQFDQYADVQARRQQGRDSTASAHPDNMQSATSTTFPSVPFSGSAAHTPPSSSGGSQKASIATPPRKVPPQGIVNPMYMAADFSAPKHPYQDYYVPPYQHQQLQQQSLPNQVQMQQQQQYDMQQQGYGQQQQAGYGQMAGAGAGGAYAGPSTMAHAYQHGHGQGVGGLGLNVPTQTQAAQMNGYAPYLPLPDPARLGQQGNVDAGRGRMG